MMVENISDGYEEKAEQSKEGGATKVVDHIEGQTTNRTLASSSCIPHLFP